MCDALLVTQHLVKYLRMMTRRLVPIIQGSMPVRMPLGVAVLRMILMIAFVGRIEGCKIVTLAITSQSVMLKLLLLCAK